MKLTSVWGADTTEFRAALLFGILLSLLPVTAFCDSSSGRDRAADLLGRGDRLFRKAKYEKALSAYASAGAASQVPLPRALLGAAKCHKQLDQHEKALASARALVAAEPDRKTLFKAQVIRGNAAYELAIGGNRLETAFELLFQALAENAKEEHEPDVLLLEAQESFEEALKLSDGRREKALRFKLADVLTRLGQTERAHDLVKAYSLDNEPAVREAVRVAAKVPGSVKPTQHTGGDLQPPRKISYPAPQYTKEARKARITGVVIVQVVIDEFGGVGDVEVLKGLPMGLNQMAIEAVEKWRFEPATLDGKPVPVFYNLTLNFARQ